MSDNTIPQPTLEKATENNVMITETVKELVAFRLAESQKDSSLDVPTPLEKATNIQDTIIDNVANLMAESRIAQGVDNLGEYTRDKTMAALVAQKIDMKLTERGAPAHEKIKHTVAYLKTTRSPGG